MRKHRHQVKRQRRGARTTRLRRPRVHRSSYRHNRVHRIPRPTFVTIAKRPSGEGGTALALLLFLPKRKAKYFSLKGWTGKSLICPSGKSARPVLSGTRYQRLHRTPRPTMRDDRAVVTRRQFRYPFMINPTRMQRLQSHRGVTRRTSDRVVYLTGQLVFTDLMQIDCQ
jgi:hypothetical protein